MKSHSYEHTAADFFKPALFPWLGVAVLAILVRLATPVLPEPHAHLDLDRTVISEKVQISKSSEPRDLILVGDSSCLMNLDASQIESITDLRTYNLGMLSFLDFPTFAMVAKNHLEKSSQPAGRMLLIVHPEFLRRSSPSRAHIEYARSAQQEQDYFYSVKSPWMSLDYLSGAWTIRNRLIGRLPNPLNGPFRQYYGFTTSMVDYMKEHQGSAVDPGTLTEEDLRGNTEYRLTDYNRMGAERFREIVGEEVEIWIGLSPVPESLADSVYLSSRAKTLEAWKEAIQPDHVLELPASLPDEQFANKTHIRPEAVEAYTEMVVKMIKIP